MTDVVIVAACVYVGVSVGDTVGALVGEALGCGVGDASPTKVSARFALEAVLRVTTPELVLTATTYVLAAMPVEVELITLLPTEMDETTEVGTTTVDVLASTAALVWTVWAIVYLGVSVGDTVGAMLGALDGMGVGNLRRYVGALVGSSMGISVGSIVGAGVGAALSINVTVRLGLFSVATVLNCTLVPITFTTNVPSVMPLVALTVEPTEMDDAMGTDETMSVAVSFVMEPLATMSRAGLYVGASVGFAVGASVGAAVG